jgi:ABC-type glycerol-3-phosphate transport system substrate-binding protein
LAGKPAAQVFVLQPNWAMMMQNRKLLYPISSSSAVDFNSSKPIDWNREVIKSMTFDGTAYAFSIGYGTSRHGTGVFFNKRLLREAGISPDLPYDMQKDGSWTWNAFLDLLKKLTRDINNDGIIDTYGMTMDLSTDILDGLVASNGANYIGRDANGRFTNATNRPEFLQALQFGLRLRTEGVLKPRPEISNWDWFKSEFTDGKVAMMVSPEWMANEIQNMKDDWGFVIFPKGPSAKDYRYSSDENVYVIPSTYSAEEVDKILAAVQLWYTPVDDDANAWKYDFYSQYRDTRAVDETLVYFRTQKYSSIKNYVYIPGLERGDIAWALWWHEGDPAQLVESVSQSWNALIRDANNIK